VGPGRQELDAAIAAATGKQFEDVTGQGDEGSGSSSGSESGSDGEQPQQQQQQQQQLQQRLNGKEAQSEAAAGAADGEEDQAGSSSGDEDAGSEAAAAAGDDAEAAEIRALLEEENVAALPYGEGDPGAAALQELDALTGLPRPDDVLMYAVPVCGPYAALVSYKYKVRQGVRKGCWQTQTTCLGAAFTGSRSNRHADVLTLTQPMMLVYGPLAVYDTMPEMRHDSCA
jgi:hypothetical protein